ncbi:hypothetical protein [Streptomyces halobius]|uniref:Lipoprotein n=1 Tax=Streptomyces halobius TaxID=2879846 RepID=A0ABY4M9T7_9ACTN|nr:hypothetical protein [Streptomyces halobius]UQA94470.1 hypothetical protein K9S39_23735 [Streptomyces halobius]
MNTAPHMARTRLLPMAGALLIGGLLISGCGASERDAVTRWPGVEHNPQAVTADQFGAAWPLKPEKGTVACLAVSNSGYAITFTTPDGKAYALNEVAEDDKGYPSAETIKNSSGKMWRLRSYGLQVCSVDEYKRDGASASPRPTS